MGLLDVDLMNRIRRTLDDRYGKGEKILFGEPWAAAETAMEGNAVPALKKNIDLLDENIGMFSDDTRDAVKGSAGGYYPKCACMDGNGRQGSIADYYLCFRS